MSAHCESCAYYDENHANSGQVANDAGLCRFNPPVTQPGPDSHGLWPVVGKEDWCGHYADEGRAARPAA